MTTNELITRGVSVFELPEYINDAFDLHSFLGGQREFVVSNENTSFVMGAFGALANPSSQHHPEVRELRTAVYKHMTSLFSDEPAFAGKCVELLPDRFSIRHQNQPVTAESWHRDVSAIIGAGDIIYGGYVNMDERQTQYFSCIPGTHLDADANDAGFAKLDKADTAAYNTRREIIAVPPRHAILFNERTIHEIAKRKIKEPTSYRQYFKWRISSLKPDGGLPEPTLGHSAIMRAVVEQGAFPLHAIGETPLPPMYGKSHVIFWGDRLETFAQNVRPEFHAPPNSKGQIFAQRFMPSLHQAGIPLFPPYTEDEVAMLFPRNLLNLSTFNKSTK